MFTFDLTRPGEFSVAERLRASAVVALDKAQRPGGAGDSAGLMAFFLQCLGHVVRAAGAVPSRTESGTSVVATGTADSNGGTTAVTITDNDGAGYEYATWTKTITAGGVLRQAWHTRIKQGAAADQLKLLSLVCNGTGSRTETWTFDDYTGVFAQQNTNLSASADTGLSVSASPDGLWWDVSCYIKPASDTTTIALSLWPAVKATGVPAATDNASLVNTGSSTLICEPPKHLSLTE